MTTFRTPETIQMEERLRAIREPKPAHSDAGTRRSLRRRLTDRLSNASRSGITIIPAVPDRDWPAHRTF